jgi:hypothetical protein
MVRSSARKQGQPERPRWPRRGWPQFTRDGIIITFALVAGAYEIVIGGGRASVLTFLAGLLVSPLVLHVDAARRGDDPPPPPNGKD